MAVCCVLLRKVSAPKAQELAGLVKQAVEGIDNDLLEKCNDVVYQAFVKAGLSETGAKGPEMRQSIEIRLSDLLASGAI